MNFLINILSNLVSRQKRFMCTRRKRCGGFTATELMMTVGVFSVIMAGTMGVYLSCQQSWHTTILDMRTSSEASIALERMVHGVGGNSGVRSAIGSTVNLVSSGDGWDLSYESADNGTNYFQYIAVQRIIVHSNSIAGLQAETIGEDIVNSTASDAGGGLNVSVSVALNEGMFSSTNTLSTFITYRN